MHCKVNVKNNLITGRVSNPLSAFEYCILNVRHYYRILWESTNIQDFKKSTLNKKTVIK